MKDEILNKNYQILEHYGMQKQIPVWIEEMSELIKELCKWQRKYEQLDGDIDTLMLSDMKFEVTDVQVCLDQIKKAINYSELSQEIQYEFKVERQLQRISGENENNN